MTAEQLVLWNAHLADAERPLDDTRWSVTIVGDRIHAVHPIDGAERPVDAIDLDGASIAPGMIDAHLHALSGEIVRNPGFGPPPELKGGEPRPRELGYFVLAALAKAIVESGFTTVRDVGSDDLEGVALRQAVDLGIVPGPQVLSCGRIVSATSPGGVLFTPMYRQADGPHEVRKAVREQIRDGADFIKIMATGARSVERENPEPAQLTREEIAVAVEEAHRLGLRVAAHAEGLTGTRIAVEEGVDTIEHGLAVHRDPALLELMAEKGTTLVPTLSTFHDLAERFPESFPQVLVDQAKRQLEEAYQSVAAARAAGVAIALGHDSGPPGDAAIELIRLVDAGLTPREGLDAATRSAALALGLEDRGLVAQGQRADLVIIDRHPLRDISVLHDRAALRGVVKAGDVVYARSAEDQSLRALEG
ncbi:amidohydrolase family protein [Aeromicrobium sp. YIM 150415]|uniref:metal-dependent hydrolase family protein n=1 Tax=Aeromicrobium sp. YIM 150415 TaxID=2803912 RepID=UPI00196539BC|nr:amidohydrolase family protein [Aeromicrobium sp. YIM 150415]MBM9462595.1 amidohydrolase family protein [Aeromicrobium sp. YIM 150415]